MPTVAVLCEFPTLLGGERSWLAALPAIREAGFTPAVFAPPDGPLADALRKADVSHIRWSVRDPSGKRPDLAESRRQLLDLLSKHPPHLVHANSLSMTRLAGPVVAECGLAGVGHVRDIVRLSRAAMRDVNRMPRLLVVSEAARRFHATQGMDAHRTFVLHNGVDLREFAPRPPHGDIARELGFPPSHLVVVTIGQVGLRKGTDVFVELARRVLQERHDVQFLIVGERTSNKEEAVRLEAELRRQAQQPPCRGNVHFAGVRQDVPDILARADMVVHAARQEPLGRVLLESAAAGKAVVATDVGGTCEVFPPGTGTAVLVPSCEPEDIGQSELLGATMRLLADSAARHELGAMARRRAEEKFDATVSGKELARHYAEVLTASTTAP
jgi:glycosyltransferase involved in cell wall biosynthesis